MNPVMRKLKSKRGASMLLAMMFMAFCVFVGGSVLSAAVANGSRVAKQSENQQEYLRQRSAALVIADELKGHPDDQLQMTVVEKTVTTSTEQSQEGNTKSANDGTFMTFEYGTKDAEGNVFQKRKFQELLYSHANQIYNANKSNGQAVNEIAEIMVVQEEFSYPDVENRSFGNSFEANYKMESDYDVIIDFGDLHLFLDATISVSDELTQTIKIDDKTTEIKATTTIIRWDDPVIRKGGASNE